MDHFFLALFYSHTHVSAMLQTYMAVPEHVVENCQKCMNSDPGQWLAILTHGIVEPSLMCIRE